MPFKGLTEGEDERESKESVLLTRLNEDNVFCMYHLQVPVYFWKEGIYVFTQPLPHEQDVTQGQLLSRQKLVQIQSFLSSWLVT